MKNSLLSYKHFRAGSAWLILLVGLGFYYLGFFEIKEGVWKEIILKIADVLVIGVIIGYLSNAAQFLGVFKRDLQDIIYGKEFLKERKDITPLWESVSKQLFKNKFPAINKEFLNVLKGYFPNNEVSYYNDYEVHSKITWFDRENEMIQVEEKKIFELIADNEKEFQYKFKNWIKINTDRSDIKNEICEFNVNGETPKITKCQDFIQGDERCIEYAVNLSGSTKYELKFKRISVYNLKDDFYIGFRAKYIVNRLRVCLEFPEDIKATFICRGTQLDFEDVNQTNNMVEKRYKGIILPRQGYIFALEKL